MVEIPPGAVPISDADHVTPLGPLAYTPLASKARLMLYMQTKLKYRQITDLIMASFPYAQPEGIHNKGHIEHPLFKTMNDMNLSKLPN